VSGDRLRGDHELDGRLAGASLLGWLRPAFRLALGHWPFTLGAGFASIGIATATAMLPGLPVGGVAALYADLAIRSLYDLLAASFVTVVAYRLLAEAERVGAVNDWQHTLIRTVQIAGIWWIAACIVGGILLMISWTTFLAGVSSLSRMNDVGDLVGTIVRNRVLGVVIGVVVFLLTPVATAIGVACALSTVHAVRSRDSAFDAVRKSLRLAFDQIWRVIVPTYVLLIVWFLVSLLVMLLALGGLAPGFRLAMFLGIVGSVFAVAYGIALTFVIERTYVPELTQPEGEAATPPPTSAEPRGGAAAAQSSARANAPPAYTGPAQNVAAQIAADLRANQVARLAENVEHGLAADPKFFVGQPDSTLALAKRLGALARPDLALRVMQPYLKEHRQHRQHFTTALFAADVLARDPRRLAEAARFLGQLKTLYPREPMVDQLIKSTERSIAAAAKPTPQPT
jgi:hypothetical protein